MASIISTGGWIGVMTREEPAVPESFTAIVVLPEKGLRWDVGVAMVDGRPHAQWVMTRSKQRPMSPELLREIDLVAVLDAAVQYEAGRQAHGSEVSVASSELDQAEGEGGFARLLDRDDSRAPRPARRRRNVTPELLTRVLELYEKSGIHVVMDEFDYSERNARRLIARARKELPARR